MLREVRIATEGRKQELKQRPWTNNAYWLAQFSYLQKDLLGKNTKGWACIHAS